MGNCATYYDELRFDTRDPEFTHVYCFIRGEGDCPFTVHGWHHKAFPKAVTTHELFNLIWTGHEDPVLWEREAPRPVETPVIFNPRDRVPVLVEQLQNWRNSFTAWDTTTSCEMADQIAGILATVPKWHEACPHCRAQEMFNKALRDEAAKGQPE